jgi:spore coat protein A
MINRRQFLKLSAAAGAGLAVPWRFGAQRAFASVQVPQTPLSANAIPQFVDPLPHFANVRVPTGPNVTISMENLTQQVLPAAAYPPGVAGTDVWAYRVDNGSIAQGPLYPAFTLEAMRGQATNVTLVNNLNNNLYQLLTVDQTLHWADPLGLGHVPAGTVCPIGAVDPAAPGWCQPYGGPVPAVVHLHGGEVPSWSDGGPDAWFTPGLAQTGPAWNNGVTNNYVYPNTQEAATIWFHDHALGITRINVYAGMAGFYLIRDNWDTGVAGTGANFPAGDYEIEIVIQDRMFDTNGQWFFPDVGLNPEHPFWVPEFVGNTIVVNGKTWPFLDVEPRRYRFRFLNGSNARFYELFLVNPTTKVMGPSLYQIGTDGGLMDAAVPLDPNLGGKLVMGPGERADVIIDFANYAGQTLLLRNTGNTPYPKGAPPNGATLGQIMQFRVVLPLAGQDTSYDPLSGQSPRGTPIVPLTNGAGALAAGVTPDVSRQLTLNEVMGPGGPLEVLVNNTKWDGMRMLPDGTMEPIPGSIPDGQGNYVTETPQVGATEVWQIINLTADAHPIHLHLVQFQLVSRQKFNVNRYSKAYNALFPGGVFVGAYGPPLDYVTGNPVALGGNPDVTPFLQGAVRPPAPNEVGWKDTVIMYPGEVTTIVARWAPTDVLVGATQKGVNQFAFDPTGGPGYVWHCHIIDHEDNEMMRPQKVIA